MRTKKAVRGAGISAATATLAVAASVTNGTVDAPSLDVIGHALTETVDGSPTAASSDESTSVGRIESNLYEDLLSKLSVVAGSGAIHHGSANRSSIEQVGVLSIGHGQEIYFSTPVRLEYSYSDQGVTVRLLDLGVEATEPSLTRAKAALFEALRREMREQLKALTHELSPAERALKRRWITTIDPALSRLYDDPREVWILGRVTKDRQGVMVFERSGKPHRSHPIPDDIQRAQRLTGDGKYRFGVVKADALGRPRGPILRLEDPIVDDESDGWREWLERHPVS